MKTFTPSILRFCLALLMVAGGLLPLSGQQLSVSNMQIFHPELFNPAYVMDGRLNNLYVGYQQRQLADPSWRTHSQFVMFKSKPAGKSDNFGFGAYILNDVEHTEGRVALGFSMAVNLFENDRFYLSTGFNVGLINWRSNYDDFRVFDRNDVLLAQPSNFAELDAGIGLAFGVDNFYYRSDLSVWTAQLPGNLLSSDETVIGPRLFPHLYGGGNFLFNIAPDVYFGPQLFYRNIFSSDSAIGDIGGGSLDAGVRIDFDRPELWMGAGWRLGNSAVTAAFGMEMITTDTLGIRSKMAYFGDLFVSASYPINNSRVFGPSVELGINIALGRVGVDGPQIDSLGLMRGAFWVNNGNMNTHRERRLTANSPPGLFAESLVGEREVELTYEWEDNQYLYSGTALEIQGDSGIAVLGDEWIGVNATLENLVGEVVDEGLVPTGVGVVDVDSVEPLKEFVSMRVISNLRFDEIQAEFGAEGTHYNGEFVGTGEYSDTLEIDFLYGDRYEPTDTFVKIWKGKLLSNFELAALKVYAMDLKMVYELKKRYSSRYIFYREGDATPVTDKLFVQLGKPQVIPNNVNLSVFQRTEIQLGFIRIPEWTPEQKTGRAAKKSKNPKEKNTRGGRKVRDQFREKPPESSR